MLKFLGYLFLSIMIFVITILITIWILVLSGNMAKVKGWWFEWLAFMESAFNLKGHKRAKGGW